jgi:hypothetical protein
MLACWVCETTQSIVATIRIRPLLNILKFK